MLIARLPNQLTVLRPAGRPGGVAGGVSGTDDVVKSALPGRLYDVFMHYKRDEWEQYLAAVTDWERERYLDILP